MARFFLGAQTIDRKYLKVFLAGNLENKGGVKIETGECFKLSRIQETDPFDFLKDILHRLDPAKAPSPVQRIDPNGSNGLVGEK